MGQTLPSTGGSAGPDASQGMAGPSDCQGILLIEIQLATNQNPQISFCGAALLPLIPSLLSIGSAALSQMQILVQCLSTLKGVNCTQPLSFTNLLNISSRLLLETST